MAYPLSSDVRAGETTLASQYNNLRADAIRLGGDAANTATLQQLLSTYTSYLKLSVSGNQINLAVSSENPCSLMIAGCPATITESIHLAISPADFPQSAEIWLFARKNPLTPGFEMIARLSEIGSGDETGIAHCIWDAERQQIDELKNLFEYQIARKCIQPEVCQGRLTLASNNPFPTSDITGASTLYFTPCFGNKISLYDPIAGWRIFPFDQLSCTLSGLSAGVCYDAFVALNPSGSVSLTLEPWSSLTMREQSPVWRDGISVSASDPRKRYVGTVALSATGVTQDTLTDRNVWNLYHQVRRPLRKLCAVSQGTNPEPGKWVPYAQDGSLAVGFVLGQNFAEAELHGAGDISVMNSNASALGIGIDIDLADFGMNFNAAELSALEYKAGALVTCLQNRVANRMIGKHRYNLITYTVNDTHTFNGSLYPQNACGLSGYVMG